jgi:hypothetical protein
MIIFKNTKIHVIILIQIDLYIKKIFFFFKVFENLKKINVYIELF